MDFSKKVNQYVSFKLETDLSVLTESERKMLPILIEAATHMDALFWKQTYGDKAALMASISDLFC